MSYEKSIPEKISNVLRESFDQVNAAKRNYLYSIENEGAASKNCELEMLQQILQLELSLRKLQSLNSASIYQEENKKNGCHGNGNHLKTV